jgi:FKBP-type peptidyl-prolyl cis-trans isomerase
MHAILAALIVLAVGAAEAQTPAASAVPPVPADVAAPPADAARSASGLASKVVTPGTGTEKPTATDVVTLHFTGWTADGKMFESSRIGAPTMFALNRAMIGMRECVQLMAVGETRRCWVPQELAYRGQAGRPAGTVVFDIELIETRRSPAVAPADVAAPPADAKRMPSGLAYKVLKPGTGSRMPNASSRVTVHYTGWTTDGKMFDSSITRGMPATFGLGDVIRGWTDGVQLMVEGERTRFWIPQDLAYKGQAGAPRGMLVFDIDLIRIER